MLRTTIVAPGRDARRHGGKSLFVTADTASACISVDDLTRPAACGLRRLSPHPPLLIAHRRSRTLSLGRRMRLHFEDRRTVLYQIHEVQPAEQAEDRGDAHPYSQTAAASLFARFAVDLIPAIT